MIKKFTIIVKFFFYRDIKYFYSKKTITPFFKAYAAKHEMRKARKNIKIFVSACEHAQAETGNKWKDEENRKVINL